MKKRALSILLCICMVITLLPTMALAGDGEPEFMGTGNGTQSNPYLLSSAQDLVDLSAFINAGSADSLDIAGANGASDNCGLGTFHGYYFKLTNDIDMTGIKWTPIGMFCGNIDGCGHTIYNLSAGTYLTSDGEYYSAFLGQIANATVTNLYFKDCSAEVPTDADPLTSRDSYVGVVAAVAIASRIENCSVINPSVQQNMEEDNFCYAGGIVGFADISSIQYCSVEGGNISIGGNAKNCQYAGGVVGCVGDQFNDYLSNYNMTVGNGGSFGVHNCFVSANITTSNYQSVGGIVGWTICDYLADTYENSYYSGTITSGGRASGLIGDNDAYSGKPTVITNCSVLSPSIASTSDTTYVKVDPLVANPTGKGQTVTDCRLSSTTKVTAPNAEATNVAGLIPEALTIDDVKISDFKSNLYGTISDCTSVITVDLYQGSDKKHTATTDSNGTYNFGKVILPGDYTLKIAGNADFKAYSSGVTVAYAENQVKNIAREANEPMPLDKSVTEFTEGSIYTIENSEQLVRLSTLVNSGKNGDKCVFKLTGDIDMTGINWEPIGVSDDTKFEGSFDGGNHTISNLKIVVVDKKYVGLFGYVDMVFNDNAYIKDLKLTQFNVSATLNETDECNLGGLIGYYAANENQISNCEVEGAINFDRGTTNSRNTFVGGLIGQVGATTSSTHVQILDNVTNVEISSSATYTGGFAGYLSDSIMVKNCGVNGATTVLNPYEDSPAVGGFVGGMFMSTDLAACFTTFQNCYVTGDVEMSSNDSGQQGAGGFLGYVVYGQSAVPIRFDGCLATGNVSLIGGEDAGLVIVGGFSGILMDAKITDCYSTGNVTANGGKALGGGFTGYSLDSTIENCFTVGDVTAADGSLNRAYAFCGNAKVQESSTNFKNCFALGGKMTGDPVSPFLSTTATITATGCGYYSGMNFGDKTPVSEGITLTALTAEQVTAAATYSTFSSDKWNVLGGDIPTLKGISADIQKTGKPNYLYATVTFDSKGGSAVEKQIVRLGTAAKKPIDPSYSGYSFAGWYTSEDGGATLNSTAFDFAAAITQNVTVYAKWSAAPSDGGSSDTTETVTNPDGSTTTTKTDNITGTITETTKKPDGSSVETVTKTDGSVTTTDKAANGVNTITKTDKDGNTTANVNVPSTVKDDVTVNIPADLGKLNGTVSAEITYPDGKKETVIGKYENGKVTITVSGNASVKLLGDFAPLTDMPFTDVDKEAYYFYPVLWAIQNEITSGTTATTFSPEDTCTRAQAVTFLWRAMGSPEPKNTNCPFTDVNADDYYYKAVLWAVEKGITDGTTATTFSPKETVSRGQVATFLWRAAGKPATSAANPFTDISSDDYYAEAVLWAVSQKITDGTTATTFSPANDCNRAQMVTFLYRNFGK